MFLTNHTNKVVKVHSAHFARGQNKEPCTGHLAASVPTKITPAAGILCFTCNPATALIFVLHASGQSMKFVFWPHPCKGSSLGNWNCVSVVFWNAGSVTLKAVKSNAARHTAHDTNPLSWRLSVKCFLPLSTKLRSKFAHKSALLSRERSFKSSADKNKKPPPPQGHFFVKFFDTKCYEWSCHGREDGRTGRYGRQLSTFIPQGRKGVRQRSKFQYRYIKSPCGYVIPPSLHAMAASLLQGLHHMTSLRLRNTTVRGLMSPQDVGDVTCSREPHPEAVSPSQT